ncbi:hypothetical protein tb265_22180 [Gemmatimonadetes bacterium T265]|nr:hypothetical protein tb265_22180 [Gemmatimonadetes bacterium T265]
MPNLRALRARLAALGLAAAAAGAACSTSVSDPNIVSPNALRDSTALPTVLNGAVGDLAHAYAGDNGNTEGVILLGGLRADEWRNSDYFDTRIQVDRGVINVNNGSVDSLFAILNIARRSAELATSTFTRLAPGDYRHAAALNIDAYAYVLLAETFCSGIPFTDLQSNGTSFAYGSPLTTQQVFAAAKARFDTAATIADAAAAGGSARAQQEAYLARVGRARALVGLGRYAEAAASVDSVPTTFEYDVLYSENTGRENNGVYGFNVINARWSVADSEGTNGLPFISAKDPRVPVTDAGQTGVDATTELFTFDKYASLSSPIPLATGTEARLIEAEAALNAQNPQQALGILNTLRATAGLAALALGADMPAQTLQLFSERAFWLFATAHRLGDMRRLVRPTGQGGYGFAITSVFPTGPYPKGGAPYGTEVNLPIPVDERNNPNFTQCIDRTT